MHVIEERAAGVTQRTFIFIDGASAFGIKDAKTSNRGWHPDIKEDLSCSSKIDTRRMITPNGPGFQREIRLAQRIKLSAHHRASKMMTRKRHPEVKSISLRWSDGHATRHWNKVARSDYILERRAFYERARPSKKLMLR